MKKRGKIFKLGLFFLISSLMLMGCANNQSSGDEKKYKIAGIMMQSDVEWFKYITLGMEAAAEKYDVELTIGNANMDVTEEANLLDTYASQGMDAVLLSALDSKASGEAIKRAQGKDVLVVNYNTNVDESIQEYFVGIDNFDLGAQAGKELVKYVNDNLGGKAKVAMVTLSMFEVGIQRAEGFLSEVEKVPGIEIVAKQDASGPEDGADVTETMLQGNPDVNLIWAANEGGAMGAVVGVQSKGLADKIKIFGTDMSLQTGNYLLDESNPYYYVSTQDPYQIGYQSVEVAVKALDGEKPAPETIVPLDAFSKDDADKVKGYLEKYKDL
jgi:sugar transport system substrate-binding protein